jgi:hypothetical protein
MAATHRARSGSYLALRLPPPPGLRAVAMIMGMYSALPFPSQWIPGGKRKVTKA